jgi:hypothetical protein
MSKNIVIFSDGTGQAGGLLPDERRSNVYKLFRAARCGPDSSVDPSRQLAFYDAGLGSGSDGEHMRTSWGRTIYRVFSQATGLGISRNIIDCYAYIIQTWEPGDRIYLFGFSRGAYTARCVGGVLSLCGVPTQENGRPIKRDAKTALRIAREAVVKVYKHGAGVGNEKTPKTDARGRKSRREELREQRLELAANFRQRYASNDESVSANALPYFVGVWDTVAALGISVPHQFLAAAIILASAIGLSSLAWFGASLIGVEAGWRTWVTWTVLSTVAVGALAYVATHLKWASGLKKPWWKTLHMTGFRLRFYDRELNPRVAFAKHALAIDENRLSFDRVAWTNRRLGNDGKPADWFEQVWFAGNHSDVGGSYPENESRLSDIALDWMVERATSIQDPLIIDRRFLNLFPSPDGIQHDERKTGWLPWKPTVREIKSDAPLHPSVLKRFEHVGTIHFDEVKPYRPEALRRHDQVGEYYARQEAGAA